MSRDFGIYPENCTPRQWWGARAIIEGHAQLDFLPDRQSRELAAAVTIEEREAFDTWILDVAIPAMRKKAANGFFRKWEDALRLSSTDGRFHCECTPKNSCGEYLYIGCWESEV